jgi:hypothetical protein
VYLTLYSFAHLLKEQSDPKGLSGESEGNH